MFHAAPAIAKAKLDRQIEQTVTTGAGGTVEVIVHPKAGYTDSVCGALDRRGQLRARHQLIGSCTAEVTIADLALLANDAAVDSISSNARVHAHQIAVSPTTTLNVTRGSVGITWGIFTGRGVGVAIIDSGIGNLQDFDRRISAFYVCQSVCRAATPVDDYGHGTHIAGLIGSTGKQTGGLWQGIAPTVNLDWSQGPG